MREPVKRILLVEDSPTQAARLSRVLAGEDLEIIRVGSAELALKELETERPDVIVLDNHLPGMSGNEFCREIRLNVNTRAIPVLMLTAEKSDAAQMQGLASGADDYVVKTVDPDILRARIRALLRKSESDAAVPDVESRFSRARLLAIDDSPTFLDYIRRELKSEHYYIETAASPVEGLQRLGDAQFDCVLVDFEMPGIDGAEVCRRIRDAQAGSEPGIVLIVISGHDDKQRMAKGFEAGADDYISKSSDFSVTRARIRALLRRKFLVEENRRIFEEIRQKELETLRARAAREAAEFRAQMADQLAATNRELDRVNQELEQFAYSAAHDLQEPLRKVRVFSELLYKQYGAKLDPQANQFVQHCVEGAGRMQQLIEDLLAYARAARARSEMVTPVDLGEVVDKVLENLLALIDESHGVVVRSPLPCLRIEEIRIQQLFQNLIGNALKYRRPDESPRVEITAVLCDSEWHFAVADNGMGIEFEYRARVFDAFSRFHSGLNEGTGLGLAICKRIVENLGGRIWVESELGRGSTFRFTLPATTQN
jgi:two-component system NtrC family sensor kinase